MAARTHEPPAASTHEPPSCHHPSAASATYLTSLYTRPVRVLALAVCGVVRAAHPCSQHSLVRISQHSLVRISLSRIDVSAPSPAAPQLSTRERRAARERSRGGVRGQLAERYMRPVRVGPVHPPAAHAEVHQEHLVRPAASCHHKHRSVVIAASATSSSPSHCGVVIARRRDRPAITQRVGSSQSTQPCPCG